jgi:hypothetical protein
VGAARPHLYAILGIEKLVAAVTVEAASTQMPTNIPEYPWFGIVDGDDIEQGDILEGCPVFLPPNDLVIGAETTVKFIWQRQDLIVMSQSCDLFKGREKVDDVLLCAVWKRSELSGVDNDLGKDERMEDARKGRLPGFHVLAASALYGFEREIRVVDFRRVYSLPVPFVRNGKGVETAAAAAALQGASFAVLRAFLYARRVAGGYSPVYRQEEIAPTSKVRFTSCVNRASHQRNTANPPMKQKRHPRELRNRWRSRAAAKSGLIGHSETAGGEQTTPAVPPGPR